MNIQFIKKNYLSILLIAFGLQMPLVSPENRSLISHLSKPKAIRLPNKKEQPSNSVKKATTTDITSPEVKKAESTPTTTTPIALKPNEIPKETIREKQTLPAVSQQNPATTPSTPSDAPVAPPANEKILAEKPTIGTKGADASASLAQELKSDLKDAATKAKDADKPSALEALKNDQIVNFFFEDATLENLARYIEQLFDIKFLADDDIEPTPQGGAVLKGHKLTFKTYQPLSRDEAWNLFLKFLDIAGLTVVPGPSERIYYITSNNNANTEVLETYFNSKIEEIPDNSGKIRYVFFAKNAPINTIQKIALSFASSSAKINVFPELNALIIVDKGSSIKSVMHILHEFDKEVPECMSVLKLKRADAQEVARLYTDLTAAENPQGAGRLFSAKSQPDALFFPNTRVIAEPRTNSLILLGAQQSIDKIETFIKTHIDKTLDMPYSPLYIYELQYTQAENMQRILSSVVDFGASSVAGQYGGVRDGDHYFRPMTITADVDGNRLIIKAEENDYLKIKEVIKKLDILQPQVAIEVLIVNVDVDDTKELGAQIRQPRIDQFLKDVDFATSGLSNGTDYLGVITPQSGSSLMGNLMALASNQVAGTTLLSLGSSVTGGIWGMLRVLQTFGKTDVISNPFLLTTNGYSAQVTVGSRRRIQTSTSLSAGATVQGLQPIEANLTVEIKPQISTDGTIQMGINISIADFSSQVLTSGDTFNKTIKTTAIVNDKEILVLGGVVKSTTSVAMTKTPILGDIPILGWFFRNKQKIRSKSNLLIFISPHIIFPHSKDDAQIYTKDKTNAVRDLMGSAAISSANNNKDPLNKIFFDEETEKTFGFLNNMTPHEHLFDKKKKNRNKKIKLQTQNKKSSPNKKRSKRGRHGAKTTQEYAS